PGPFSVVALGSRRWRPALGCPPTGGVALGRQPDADRRRPRLASGGPAVLILPRLLLPPDENLAPLVSIAREQTGFTEAVGNLVLSAGCRRMPNIPEIVEVDNTQLEEVLHRVEAALDEKDAALIRAVFASYVYVTDLVEDKNTSIRRLRQLLFG